MTFKVAGTFYKHLTLPPGEYVFEWEDDIKWCYRDSKVRFASKSEHGELSFDGYITISKRYDVMGVMSLLTGAELRRLGLGEFVVAMQPKRGDHYLMGEGGIPREHWSNFEFTGEIPIESTASETSGPTSPPSQAR